MDPSQELIHEYHLVFGPRPCDLWAIECRDTREVQLYIPSPTETLIVLSAIELSGSSSSSMT